MDEKQNENLDSNNLPIKLDLEVEVYDKDGKLKSKIKKDNDPLTRWSVEILSAVIRNEFRSIKAEDGSVGTFRTGTDYFHFCNKIAIGTSNKPFSFDDFRLDAKYMETTTITKTTISEIGNTYQYELISSFLIPEDKTIYETGLFGTARLLIGGTTYERAFLVSRDVFPEGLSVSANDVVVVRYKFVVGTI